MSWIKGTKTFFFLDIATVPILFKGIRKKRFNRRWISFFFLLRFNSSSTIESSSFLFTINKRKRKWNEKENVCHAEFISSCWNLLFGFRCVLLQFYGWIISVYELKTCKLNKIRYFKNRTFWMTLGFFIFQFPKIFNRSIY